jgi:hypothetical protein
MVVVALKQLTRCSEATYSFVLRGGLPGLGGVLIGFGNGFADGSPRGGSGVIGFPLVHDL